MKKCTLYKTYAIGLCGYRVKIYLAFYIGSDTSDFLNKDRGFGLWLCWQSPLHMWRKMVTERPRALLVLILIGLANTN